MNVLTDELKDMLSPIFDLLNNRRNDFLKRSNITRNNCVLDNKIQIILNGVLLVLQFTYFSCNLFTQTQKIAFYPKWVKKG